MDVNHLGAGNKTGPMASKEARGAVELSTTSFGTRFFPYAEVRSY